jgi:FtsP/CotA-like multicopper oxidase with cupredoxin domain
VLAGPGFERTIDLQVPGYIYTAAQQAADGWAGPLVIRVSQLGTHASSRAAEITFG